MTTAQAVCSNPDCRVVETGICAKKYPLPDACPDYAREDLEALDPGDEEDLSSANVEISPDVQLSSNRLIPEQRVSAVRSRIRCQTIVLVGEQKSGKTTLLAALYGLLCKGEVGGRSFVESSTLYSFAERYHLALVSSNLEAPTTPRTSRADSVGFFHLRVRTDDRLNDILISDRSGEAFEAASVVTDLLTNLIELAIADRVCFLLDAARLTAFETRSNYRRVFKQMIHALIDNDKIPSGATIEVLITKIDLLASSDDERDLETEVTLYEEELRREFAGCGYGFEIYRVCALPRANPDMGLVGVGEMLARWSPPPNDDDMSPGLVSDPERQFDLLTKIWG